jgi:hypothetical protein
MSIQRWDVAPLWADRSLSETASDEGKWVTYADHVAAVAEAEQRVREDDLDKAMRLVEAREKAAIKYALDAAREAVAAACYKDDYTCVSCTNTALAAIDARKKKS